MISTLLDELNIIYIAAVISPDAQVSPDQSTSQVIDKPVIKAQNPI